MTATSDTQRELIAAILAEPDEDTPRLAYADCIEENGDADWAELIRVQCELATRFEHYESGSTCAHIDTHKRYDALRKQESTLTAALCARLLPPCPDPVCKGRGRWEDDRTGPTSCGLCKETGLCPGEIRRGFGVCRVPLSVWGKEAHSGTDLTGTASPWRWIPTPFAIAALALGCVPEPSDREPWDNMARHVWLKASVVEEQRWARRRTAPAMLCDTVFDALEGHIRVADPWKSYPTKPAATAALSAALVRLTRGVR